MSSVMDPYSCKSINETIKLWFMYTIINHFYIYIHIYIKRSYILIIYVVVCRGQWESARPFGWSSSCCDNYYVINIIMLYTLIELYTSCGYLSAHMVFVNVEPLYISSTVSEPWSPLVYVQTTWDFSSLATFWLWQNFKAGNFHAFSNNQWYKAKFSDVDSKCSVAENLETKWSKFWVACNGNLQDIEKWTDETIKKKEIYIRYWAVVNVETVFVKIDVNQIEHRQNLKYQRSQKHHFYVVLFYCHIDQITF